ncbi:MerR family transcriptional regulator [Cohnella sp. GCM10027633]|uniref:MerR family transcriptional regulator n=1 Tax=unclassified Cohnella TaxID=2636738 RepID=UPI0036267350
MYTINEVAQRCDISAYTLRFYDKEGLLPFVSRTPSGNRSFSDADLEMVKLICCLKNTGMPIKEIKRYIDLFMLGADTADDRKRMMIEHRKSVLKQIDDLKKNVNLIDLKIAFYDNMEARLAAHHRQT